eukprot:CAMPEP_0185905638 /NCGR_PEP_ID=MMETSP0196C-20130402/4837_1 /TAXON_ID=2932 /ORGANISM="Alexandrium fundyense, Strain CCMP1719" /LENGTH=35 /DNA_ID= /DNA_START= /DNA_END= /DNA_ORIENTATION=
MKGSCRPSGAHLVELILQQPVCYMHQAHVNHVESA